MQPAEFMKKSNIGIITFPITNKANTPLSNLLDIIYPIANELYLIKGNYGYTFFKEDARVHAYGIMYESGANVFTRILQYLYAQLRISYKLAKLSRNVDLWIFFIGGDYLVLPVLTAKLLRKNAVIASAGSGLKVAQCQKDPLATALAGLQNITYCLADRIIMYSQKFVEEYGLQNYHHKISIAHRHFLDFDKFNIRKGLGERENSVGYIGALNQAKGIPNLLEAIPRVLKRADRIKFLIGGDGELRNEVERYSGRENLNGNVNFVGWIPHHELPDYLNELKLLILPSYTEGLPNIILEAMACGTPVLATPVGGIPDVIKDGETGFILENNSPECIAENVIRALNHPNLEKIAGNARALVERDYPYEKAVERYRDILNEVSRRKA